MLADADAVKVRPAQVQHLLPVVPVIAQDQQPPPLAPRLHLGVLAVRIPLRSHLLPVPQPVQAHAIGIAPMRPIQIEAARVIAPARIGVPRPEADMHIAREIPLVRDLRRYPVALEPCGQRSGKSNLVRQFTRVDNRALLTHSSSTSAGFGTPWNATTRARSGGLPSRWQWYL